MELKKILSIFLVLGLFVNISFAAFDPYADDEVEKKSYKKLYYGIVLTLLGGFLTYDGFSMEKVDVSKPSVDYTSVLQAEWVQPKETFVYRVRSGYSHSDPDLPDAGKYEEYKIDNKLYTVEENILYNNGNVDLHNVEIEVRYKHAADIPIGDGSYHIATNENSEQYINIDLAKGKGISWRDVWSYETQPDEDAGGDSGKNNPYGEQREPYKEPNPGTNGLLLGKNALRLIDIRVKLKKNQQYKPIYEKRHKSDIEGVAGILIGITGIYFIVDHFIDMHKFNAYAKRHNLNLKVATASNGYKLMLQKRI